jgi:predicted nucleotidyltransferase component of viral defense system
MERLVANVVTGQMLPPGVVKGGTALKIRVGDEKTRFSRDLDEIAALDAEKAEVLSAIRALGSVSV